MAVRLCYHGIMSEILLVRSKIPRERLLSFLGRPFDEMIKYVVDVEQEVIALGGELHADAESVLLAAGSSAVDLWGANLYPHLPPEQRIEFTSLINISPARGNPSMEVMDPRLRERIRRITERLLLNPDETLA